MIFSKLISIIAGEYPKYSMEHRALNILNFFVAFNCFCGGLLGLFIGMNINYILSQTIVSFFVFLLYFFSKKYRNRAYITTISVVGILILFFFTFFTEGGLNGPTYGIALGFFVIFISLTKHPVYVVVYPLAYICTLTFSLILNYLFPDWVSGYPTESQRYIDYLANFFQTIIPVYFLFLSNQECYRYEQEQVLQKNNQLAVANATKEKLFAIIGHDLRSPIASLDSLFLMLKDKRISKDELPHQLQQIQNKTGQIRDLLDNLLYWAVSQMEHMQTDAMLLSPYQLAEVELSMLRELAAYKHLTLVNNLLPAATIFADSEQSKIILRNLLTNAVKYASEGGDVVISSEERNNMQIITVTNTGKWLEEQAPHPTFDPKRKGFGLFLSKEFATKNGGSLTVNATDSDIVIVTWTVPKNSGAVLRR